MIKTTQSTISCTVLSVMQVQCVHSTKGNVMCIQLYMSCIQMAGTMNDHGSLHETRVQKVHYLICTNTPVTTLYVELLSD